jgi:ABC-type Na+ efflux pump permease subunit
VNHATPFNESALWVRTLNFLAADLRCIDPKAAPGECTGLLQEKLYNFLLRYRMTLLYSFSSVVITFALMEMIRKRFSRVRFLGAALVSFLCIVLFYWAGLYNLGVVTNSVNKGQIAVSTVCVSIFWLIFFLSTFGRLRRRYGSIEPAPPQPLQPLPA